MLPEPRPDLHQPSQVGVAFGAGIGPARAKRRATTFLTRYFSRDIRRCSGFGETRLHRRYVSRNALTMGMRTARSAGNRPPTRPMLSAMATPRRSTLGPNRNENVI